MSLMLNTIVRELWLWCMNQDFTLVAEHLLGVLSCRPRIPGNEGPVRLDVESQDLQQDPKEMESTGSGHACLHLG